MFRATVAEDSGHPASRDPLREHEEDPRQRRRGHFGGQPATFTANASFNLATLTITLTTTAPNATVTIASPELLVSKGLAGKVKNSNAGELAFAITATDTQGTATLLSLKLSPT